MRSGALIGIILLAVVSLLVWGLLEVIRRHINTPPEVEKLRRMQLAGKTIMDSDAWYGTPSVPSALLGDEP